MRRILGVLSLAKKYGAADLDDACAAALEDRKPAFLILTRVKQTLGLRNLD